MALVPRSVQYQLWGGRRIPGDSPGRSTPLRRPGPRSLAAMIVPTLEDLATMSAKVISSGAWEWESRKVFSGQRGMRSGTIVSVLGVRMRCWRAAAAVIVLLVEPGSNMSAMARFLRASGLLLAIRLGSKVGMLAMARTSPVRGLITTTEPAL